MPPSIHTPHSEVIRRASLLDSVQLCSASLSTPLIDLVLVFPPSPHYAVAPLHSIRHLISRLNQNSSHLLTPARLAIIHWSQPPASPLVSQVTDSHHLHRHMPIPS
ncbi:hypothetical protein NW759_010910 [Fusarium solani]|nr:hypothetical protein NW759_010910 [Fusarium solani]